MKRADDRTNLHMVTRLFPTMDTESFTKLKDDIKKNGLKIPVVFYKGKVVDGRHRFKACQELGITDYPRVEWDGQGSLVDFVVSTNLHRRHLTPSQLAATAVETLVMFEREAASQAAARNLTVEQAWEADQQGKRKAKTREIAYAERAANLLNIGTKLVRDAKELGDKSPVLLNEIKDGHLSVPQAQALVELPEVEREEIRKAAEEVGWGRAIRAARQEKVAAATATASDATLVAALEKFQRQVIKLELLLAGARLIADELGHTLQGAAVDDAVYKLKGILQSLK